MNKGTITQENRKDKTYLSKENQWRSIRAWSSFPICIINDDDDDDDEDDDDDDDDDDDRIFSSSTKWLLEKECYENEKTYKN